ncbi:MAG: conjugal transfer protein TraC [Sulfobacillus acidophilus]|uniref:Conjugal transfer protein TraC n=1 Tax=Sulfobacillus acidophilus TaxID=53633 RepID=A0A2T2WGB1_9FIRM|nr:MAG: conjugal transfer protein TraC [Sulfobacillus acidophilus]
MELIRRRRKLDPRDDLDALWPSHIRFHPDYIEIGDRLIRTYTIVAYPREVQAGWFEPLLAFPNPASFVFHSAPVDTGVAVRSMNRRMLWSRGSTNSERMPGGISQTAQAVALADAEHVRLELAKGETRMIEVGLTVALWAYDQNELDQSSRLFESLAQGMMMVARPLRYQQDLGLRQILPLGDFEDKVREMDTRVWSTLFPFASRDVIHPQGQLLGVNSFTKSFIIVDRFQMASPHSITIGWSGSGKSFAAKLDALRSRYRGWAVTVIDPEGEYYWLDRVGATVWALGDETSPGFPFDPFSISAAASSDERARETDFLLRFLRRLAPELMEDYGNLVHDAVWHALARQNASFSPMEDAAASPTRFWQGLSDMAGSAHDRLNLAWQRWGMAVGHPIINCGDGQFEVFDLRRVGTAMKGTVYLALTEWLLRRMGREQLPRLIIFDEAWHLLNDVESASYLEELFRRARKWGTAVSLLSQDIGDFLRSRAAEVCLRNAPMVLLLRQHAEGVAEVAHMLRLHEREVQMIVSASPGEGLLLLGDDHLPIQVIASTHERDLLSTATVRGS